jgi:hypothetical protein
LNNVCDVCGTTPVAVQPPLDGLPSHGRDCPRCGKFWLVGTAAEALRQLILRGVINKSVLSHRLRRRFDARQNPIVLYETDLQLYVGDTALPKPQEQTDNLILWIGDSQKTPDDWAQGTPQRIAAIVGAAKTTDRSDEPGFNWLYSQIAGSGLFDKTDSNNGSEIRLRLKMTGWKLYDELRKRVLESHTAFMAMKFGDQTMDKVLIQCFKPAVKLAGFELRALNEKQSAGLIDNQIRAAIRSARFVVADLTHDNNGAYFEAGFAEGVGLPVIYTCEAKKFTAKKTHFDTNHLVTIPWTEENLADAASRLTATVRATLPAEAKLTDG